MKDSINKQYTQKQLLLSQWIRELGFGNTLEKNFPPYFLDIYIEELGIGIEVDSNYHISKKRDAVRDAYLKNNFKVTVIRVNEKEIKPKNKVKLLGDLREMVEKCAE